MTRPSLSRWCALCAVLASACPPQQEPEVAFSLSTDERTVSADGVQHAVITVTVDTEGTHSVRLKTPQGTFSNGASSIVLDVTGFADEILTSCTFGVDGCGGDIDVEARIGTAVRTTAVFFADPGDDEAVWPWGTCGDFDPARMHVHGLTTLRQGTRPSIAPLAETAGPCTAFPPDVTTGVIRNDGAYVYLQAGKLFVFTPEELVRGVDTWTYPEDFQGNDVEISTAGCDAAGGARDVLAWPDRAAIAFQCSGALLWLQEDGVELASGDDDVIALGYAGRYLVQDQSNGAWSIRTLDGESLALDGPDTLPLAVRATPTGFRLAVDEGAVVHAWTIANDGTVMRGGAYASDEAPFTTTGGCLLDASGGLYCAGEEFVDDDPQPAVSLRAVDGSAPQLIWAESRQLPHHIDDPRLPLTKLGTQGFLVSGGSHVPLR